MVETIIYGDPAHGGIIYIGKKWDNVGDHLAHEMNIYRSENDPWNKLRMYVNMVLTKPKRSKAFTFDPHDAHEYMDETAVVALPSAMDALFTMLPYSAVAEKLFILLGGLTPVPNSDGRGGQWLMAPRGFRGKVKSLLKKLDEAPKLKTQKQ